MLTGDVGRTAVLARDGSPRRAPSSPLFHPLKFMLASPAEDAAEIIGRLGPTVWVEDKYDGIRAQLHRAGRDVRLYSRDLHDISGQFPEIVAGARGLGWDGILDGEILAYRDGTVLPFLALQKRLGRKAPSAAIQAEVPVDLRRLRRAGPGRAGRRRDRAAGRAAPRPATAPSAAGAARSARTCRSPTLAAGSPRPTSSRSTRPRSSSRRFEQPARGATRGSWSRTRPAPTHPAGAGWAG